MHIHKRRLSKINQFVFDSLLLCMDASHLPAVNVIVSGGAFVPLRGGASENALPKAGQATADISDNARAAYL